MKVQETRLVIYVRKIAGLEGGDFAPNVQGIKSPNFGSTDQVYLRVRESSWRDREPRFGSAQDEDMSPFRPTVG